MAAQLPPEDGRPSLTPGPGEEIGDPTLELDALRREVDDLPRGEPPCCGGVVVLAGRGPVDLLHHAAGWAVRWADRDRELPRERWEPVRPDTPFDLASLTKLFTAILAVGLMEEGELAPDTRVAERLPEFGAAGKGSITVRHLLAHTSGLRPELPLYDAPPGRRLEPLWRESPLHPPDTVRIYSDLNLIALGVLLERVTGRRLDALLRERVTEPLGMGRTRFGPVPGAAATEDQRRPVARLDRGMVRGAVHDENAFALGGVAGHAGLFSTAADLGRLCRALLAGGGPILAPRSVGLLLDPPGLGFTVDQPWFMGALAGRGAAGHTGFTGTSLVVDRSTDAFLVLLATTVHPVRHSHPDSRFRAAAADRLARAIAAGAGESTDRRIGG
ncbi:serine hydrolase domain-containing protein [Streptomyces alkaliphilus]|uniref:serine hydrolase domain-containing protein n=1 Tax=Streptomyces alkaliphilus TaxID=1472722 RepID=UPI00117D88C6|nr:serine hydrolase domain-containing protein [Streptomyces alkaliphilus]MQS06658.1 serine hydrolase [Streptomyces alkaliphilus]